MLQKHYYKALVAIAIAMPGSLLSTSLTTAPIQKKNILKECCNNDFLITQSDIPKTISQSGVYQLSESVTVNSGDTGITISADNVILNLNCRTISGGATGISIGSNKNNIIIQNGLISGCTATGISVASGCTDVTLQDVRTKNIGTGSAGIGINLASVTNSIVRHCSVDTTAGTGLKATSGQQLVIENCAFNNNIAHGTNLLDCAYCSIDQCKFFSNGQEGLLITSSSHDITVNNCSANKNNNHGFSLVSSNNVLVTQCQSLGNSRSSNIAGFATQDGSGNVFEKCIAHDIISTSTGSEEFAAGFALLGAEKCTRVLNCKAGKITTPIDSKSIPYGILLQPTFDTLNTVTHNLYSGTGNYIAWMSDPNFLVLGTNTISGAEPNTVRLYEFNRSNLNQPSNNFNALIERQRILPGGGNQNTFAIACTNDTNVVATGHASGSLRIWSFDKPNKQLKQITTLEVGASVNALAWSPNNKFLVVGANSFSGNNVHIYEFNSATPSLTLRRSIAGTAACHAVSFSPDGNIIAVGSGSSDNTTLTLYAFDQNNGGLNAIPVDTKTLTTQITGISWSFDSNYLAVCEGLGAPVWVGAFYLFTFNKVTKTLTQIDSRTGFGVGIESIAWAPDGKSVVISAEPAFYSGSPASVRLYPFSRNTNKMSSSIKFNQGNITFSLDWSRDGRYLAIAGHNVNGTDMHLLAALKFPTKNVITNNIIYCVTGNEYSTGVGISGSSMENVIVGNKAYHNDFNYHFSTNTFNDGLNGSPTILQNISIPTL